MDTGYLLNNPFEPADLPKGAPDKKGLMPYKSGTYGICTIGGSYIESENSSKMYAYGGEYGAYAGSFFEITDTSLMELHGGRIGGQSNSYFTFVYSNNTFKAYGSEIGVSAGTSLSFSTGNNNYLYGYGETYGVNAATTISMTTNSYLVAETVADGSPGLVASHPHAQPAINCQRSTSSITISNNAIVHELYNVKNYNISTLPPYAINNKMAAIGANMGTNPATLLKLNWTTPLAPPAKAADGRDYLNYDAADDQKLMKAGTAGGVTGLIAYGSLQNATLVGQSRVSARDMVSGATGNTISSSSGTTSTYRITLLLVNVEDLSTMDVRLDLMEGMEDEIYAMQSVPTSLVYQLTFQSVLSSQTPQTIQLTENDLLDVQSGTLLLPKLREGDYWLTPVNDVGWPFEGLPEIHFRIVTDTSAKVPDNGNYGDYWSKKLELVSWKCASGAEHARLVNAGSTLPAGSGNVDPAFPPPEAQYDVEAFWQGSIALIYRRLPYHLDLKLLDAESFEQLPGAVAMRPTLGGQPVPGLDASTTLTNGGTSASPLWDTVTVYAGLTYTFEQAAVGWDGYIMAGGSFVATVNQNAGTPVLDVVTPNDAYQVLADTEEPYFSLWVLNDLPIAEVPLSLVDEEDFEKSPQTFTYLPGASFRLEVRYRDGTTADITSIAVVDNGDGTFTLKLKPGRDSYYLTQTQSPPDPNPLQTKKYQRRRSTNRFSLEVIAYDTSGTEPAIADYSLMFVSESGDDGGWVEPENHDEKSIWVTNMSPAIIAALTVEVNATGLWHGHGNAVFIVELRSTDASKEKVYYKTVEVRGSVDAEDYGGESHSGRATFDPLPLDEYTVTVYPSLRTGNTSQSTVILASATSEVTASFHFTAQNSAYYSDEDAVTNQFHIEEA